MFFEPKTLSQLTAAMQSQATVSIDEIAGEIISIKYNSPYNYEVGLELNPDFGDNPIYINVQVEH